MTGPEQMPKRQPTVSGSGHDLTETCRACGGLGEVYKQRPWQPAPAERAAQAKHRSAIILLIVVVCFALAVLL